MARPPEPGGRAIVCLGPMRPVRLSASGATRFQPNGLPRGRRDEPGGHATHRPASATPGRSGLFRGCAGTGISQRTWRGRVRPRAGSSAFGSGSSVCTLGGQRVAGLRVGRLADVGDVDRSGDGRVKDWSRSRCAGSSCSVSAPSPGTDPTVPSAGRNRTRHEACPVCSTHAMTTSTPPDLRKRRTSITYAAGIRGTHTAQTSASAE
jgi:hypothetical protein